MTLTECENMLKQAEELGRKEAKAFVDAREFGTKEAARIECDELARIISSAFILGYDYAIRQQNGGKQ